ncbi:hypothetical protein GCM10010981_17640 [Dyella nitratireducens]|uniref:Uncharacterized protein n=1 Tax=Dyella nitratireducens TaxID=1849580 RepID=A0ABQ1FSE2_9GAMM|nr:hypothetical protein GCM10010981_17640 [Dyella nitratireducens]GLQ43171.1 hypothetical protein GCM10007902_30210 [Dyella nitratireducens]
MAIHKAAINTATADSDFKMGNTRMLESSVKKWDIDVISPDEEPFWMADLTELCRKRRQM